MAGISDPFAVCGLQARTKILVLGPARLLPESVADQVSSLNLEHVSPAGMMRPEISRRHPDPASAGQDASTAHMRRWFFARKPDAGFLLSEFPATLLQAKIFDEWLDARDEVLSTVIATDPGHPAVGHYRALGLLWEPTEAASAP
jgi:adenylate kinase